VLLTDVLLFAFPVDRGNLFSCHHKISIFCKSSEDLSPLQYAFRRMLTSESVARKYMNINNLSKFVVLNPTPRTCFIHWFSISYPPRARCDDNNDRQV
ncbi:MAG: hypothetical protein SOZ87_11785, partial [Candidatus Cryptobacteroides sp.]|nr:hypothetical protein [Candidatus Cryptobacteroides sp.]